MILVMDLSFRPDSLSTDEFVAPVERIVRRERHVTRILHYTGISPEELPVADGAILCGTALADFGYLDHLERFAWLPAFPSPVLGICAGMEVMTRIFGGKLTPGIGIGMMDQEVTTPDPLVAGRDRFAAYELHSLSVVPPVTFQVLAFSPSGVQAIRHRDRPMYGVMFHPEVRNEWLIRRFLSLCSSGGGDKREALEGEQAS